MSRKALRHPYVAEALGTAGMVLAGCGAIVAGGHGLRLGTLGIAFAFGGAVTAMILTFGATSGAHLNPAVTLGLVADGRLAPRHALPYLVAQTTGALGAALVLVPFASDAATLGVTQPRPDLTLVTVLGIEVLLTALLMGTILVVVRVGGPRWAGAGAIGGAVALGAALGGPWTGASMNPARSLGPALATGDVALVVSQWPYLVAPAVGALGALGLVRAIPLALTKDQATADPEVAREDP